jgi:protein ATS1
MTVLYGLGSNASGQLGIGHQDDVSSPTLSIWPLTKSRSPVVKVTAGGNHTLVLLESGELLVAGDNSNGRCFFAPQDGGGTKLNRFQIATFQESDTPRTKVLLCSATWEASTVVLSDGRIISSGTGLKGELGLGNEFVSAKIPRAIPLFPPAGTVVVDLAASMSHTVAVLSNGEVWGWGNGRKGQLGLPADNLESPRKIEEVKFHAYRAVCGKDHTFIIGSPETGETLVLGTDRFCLISDAPSTIPGWRDVASSWGSIFVLLADGNIIAWGRNDHKQLPPPNLAKIKQLAVGSEHAVALTEQGNAIAWGWGEHGNCGVAPKNAQNDFGLTEIRTSSAVVGLGAGCATSWIIARDLDSS